MKFPWKTLGHTKQKQEIENNILNNSLAHATLFLGPKHIGKFQFAQEIVQAILCPNMMCNTCSVCKELSFLSYPDYIVVDGLYYSPKNIDKEKIALETNISQDHREKSKTDTIGIKDVSEILRLVSSKPVYSKKFCLIRNIDRMNEEASNAFLKTLEDPPKNTYFLFTSAKESKILETLLSRMRVIRFHLLPESLIENEIKNHPDKEKISNLAQGRITVAQKLSESPELLKMLSERYEKISQLENASLKKKFAFSKEISDNHHEIERLFEYMTLYYRSKILTGDTRFLPVLQKINESERLLQGNINKRLILDSLFLFLHNLSS
jgi:DNA polymerase-3 subunit delta'